MKCLICEKEFKSNSVLSKHISSIHNILKQEYYDKFLKKENEGICKTCGKPTKFKNIILGYFEHCCSACSRNDSDVITKTENTTLKRYGSKNIRNSEYYETKSKTTKITKYGDENYNNREKAKMTCIEKYGKEYPMQVKEIEQKRDRTNMALFGTNAFKNNLKEKYGSEKYRNIEKAKSTCIQRYGCENPFSADEIKEKIKNTLLDKYGVSNIMQCSENIESIKLRNRNKYGYDWPQQNSDIRKKQQHRYTFNDVSFDSAWEIAYYIWLLDNNMNFVYQPDTTFSYFYNEKEHAYHPDFLVENRFIEIKGPQFFENEKMINPYDRTMDDMYEAKHQCMIKNCVKIITDCTEYIKYVNTKYSSDFLNLFKNNLEFPYPNRDLNDTTDYGLIQHFHKSIYEAKRKKHLSPIDAWQNKNLIYKCALNRLKYVGRCRMSDILQGFNVSKIAPKISVFKPSLAKKLIQKYLNDYSEIFDPFSGFSGRMLGAIACEKRYIGHDINQKHIEESKKILEYKNYINAELCVKDIFDDVNKEYECLFTCPPYEDKEMWNDDDISKTCDEWIDICISKYKCKKYLFVVDETEKYKDKIVQTIENKSHFGTNVEYIILI